MNTKSNQQSAGEVLSDESLKVLGKLNQVVTFSEYELFIWASRKDNLAKAILIPPRSNGLLIRAIKVGSVDPEKSNFNVVLDKLQQIMWFPLGLGENGSLALENLAQRLNRLPENFDDFEEWFNSVGSVFSSLEAGEDPKKQAAEVWLWKDAYKF